MKRHLPTSNTTTPFGHLYSGSSKRRSFLTDSNSISAKYYFGLETPHCNSTTTSDNTSTSVRRKANSGALGRIPPSNVYSSGAHPTSRPTPRTTNTPSHPQSSTIVAIVEGRGLAKGEIGMTSFDLKGSELVLSQFSDSPTYVKVLTKIQILQPVEVILPNTAFENGNVSALFEVLSEQFPFVTLTTVQRRYFNETQGLDYIKQLCVPEFKTVEMDVQSKYYCLATCAALVKYVEFIQNIMFAPNTLKVVFKGGEQTMLIDGSAASNLELVQNSRDMKSNHSLYGILNYTKTAGGGRLMRSNILQPSYDLSTILQRYDCIDELTEDESLFLNLQSVLGRFLDVDHLISCLIQLPKKEGMKVFEKKITDSIYLKHTIELVPTLRQTLKNCENTLFKAYYQSLEDPRFGVILEEIQTVVHDETRFQKGILNMRTQKLFAVKPNVNGLLDVARRSHCEVVDDITAIVEQEAETSGLQFTPSFNATRGFYMQLPLSSGDQISMDNLPPRYLKVVKTKNVISCTTEDLLYNNISRQFGDGH